MKEQTEERKALKKKLAADFKKTFKKDYEALGISAKVQDRIAREALKQAGRDAKTPSDGSLRRAFSQVKKTVRERLEEVKVGLVFISGYHQPAPEPDVLRPAPQPPSVSIPSGNGPVWHN